MGRIGMTPPKFTRQIDPDFSDEARRRKFNGNVEVGLEVDTSGHPVDLWVIGGAGMDLDEKAAELVSQYEFKPATCHGQPVPVQLYVDVNFRTF
jgi:protein TonB